ncbi:MAG: hypothetical protein N2C14_30390, partial [Planctomycetales bacterium]
MTPTNSPAIDIRKVAFAIVFSLSILFVNLSRRPEGTWDSEGAARLPVTFGMTSLPFFKGFRSYGWPLTAAQEFLSGWGNPASLLNVHICVIGLLVNIAFSFVLLCQAIRAIERWAPRFSIRFLL